MTTTVQCTALDSNLPNSRAHIPVCVHLNLEYPEHKRVRLCSILPNTESDSAVSFLPQIEILQYPAHHRVRLCSVLPITESDVFCPVPTKESVSAVSCPPWSQTLQYPCHRESDSAVSCPPQRLTHQYLDLHRVRLCCVLLPTESVSAVSCPPWSETLQYPVHHGVRLCSILSTMSQTPRSHAHCRVSLII